MLPQLENGYTRIANEILDALIRFRIPGEQRQCLDFIIRKTYGFNKLEDQISNSQFCEATGLYKSNVSRAIKALINKNIVIKKDNKVHPTYRFNKDYNKWVLSKKITRGDRSKVLSKKISAVIKKDNFEFSEILPVVEDLSAQTTDDISLNISQPSSVIKEKVLLSKLTDTKDSNTVTKERELAVGGFKNQKPTVAYIENLKLIASGRTDHTIVSSYAWSGESFSDMKIRASRELEELKREG